MRQLDWRAAGAGALLTLAVLEPPVQFIKALKADDPSGAESNWWVVGAAVFLVAYAVGGWFAARRKRSAPFMHGAAAAAIAFAVDVIVIRTVVRLASGDGLGLNIANTLLVAQIAISLGVLGAYVATRRRARHAT